MNRDYTVLTPRVRYQSTFPPGEAALCFLTKSTLQRSKNPVIPPIPANPAIEGALDREAEISGLNIYAQAPQFTIFTLQQFRQRSSPVYEFCGKST